MKGADIMRWRKLMASLLWWRKKKRKKDTSIYPMF